MGSNWRKAKLAFGLNLCLYVPKTLEDSPPAVESTGGRLSGEALLSPASWKPEMGLPATPSPSSYDRKLSKSSSKSSKETCSICLTKMKQGGGQAIFTAECTHSFHFHCIASNVKHGNQICPVCRAKWKEIPLQGSFSDPSQHRAPVIPVGWPRNDALVNVVRRLPMPRRNLNRHNVAPLLQSPEPAIFDDDESIDLQPMSPESSSNDSAMGDTKTIGIKTFTEVSAAPKNNSYDDFTVLIHLKAAGQNFSTNRASFQHCRNPRAPVDIVTVLDVSGSMAGTKLALLKRAMGFVIQNLGSNDRLSVIAFSSTARRLFPLRRMSDTGRHQALQAVNLLVANGGTNIAEALRKGVKVMDDRTEKNPVASIILLSDGQDTYSDTKLLVPDTVQTGETTGFHIPVHAFGFGADHDAASMHSISETSGGTFSFIETQAAIQDAFAQCIGGLLSVVAQGLQVGIECADPSILLRSIKAGSYHSHVTSGAGAGFIDVGDLYADEEKDFLISINVPAQSTALLKVTSVFTDPISKETVALQPVHVKIERTQNSGQQALSLEVDRQRNRVRAAEAMSEARGSAESGDLPGAVSKLENFRKALSKTVSCHDKLCVALDAELREMQERMASRHVYEASGRAYMLSGLSSHSWQRATARGDSTEGSSLLRAYQTPSMTDMVNRSQAGLSGSPSARRLVQPLLSQARPR